MLLPGMAPLPLPLSSRTSPFLFFLPTSPIIPTLFCQPWDPPKVYTWYGMGPPNTLELWRLQGHEGGSTEGPWETLAPETQRWGVGESRKPKTSRHAPLWLEGSAGQTCPQAGCLIFSPALEAPGLSLAATPYWWGGEALWGIVHFPIMLQGSTQPLAGLGEERREGWC